MNGDCHAKSHDLSTPQEFFLGQPASEYQFVGYDPSSMTPGKVLYQIAVPSES